MPQIHRKHRQEYTFFPGRGVLPSSLKGHNYWLIKVDKMVESKLLIFLILSRQPCAAVRWHTVFGLRHLFKAIEK